MRISSNSIFPNLSQFGSSNFELGLHRGSLHRFWNPEMAPYLLGLRNCKDVFSLEESLVHLQRGLQFLYFVKNKGKIIFLIPNRLQNDPYGKIIKAAAESCNQPWVLNENLVKFLASNNVNNGALLVFGGDLPRGDWKLPTISVLDSFNKSKNIDYVIPSNFSSLSVVYFLYSCFSLACSPFETGGLKL